LLEASVRSGPTTGFSGICSDFEATPVTTLLDATIWFSTLGLDCLPNLSCHRGVLESTNSRTRKWVWQLQMFCVNVEADRRFSCLNIARDRHGVLRYFGTRRFQEYLSTALLSSG
jgi:hypothetical protein